jgi:predicted RNA binding protein YcfA (HicA-like mRNA interferase family)
MPEKLPVISGKEAMRAFENAGWQFVRVGSSRHYIYKKEGRNDNYFINTRPQSIR